MKTLVILDFNSGRVIFHSMKKEPPNIEEYIILKLELNPSNLQWMIMSHLIIETI